MISCLGADFTYTHYFVSRDANWVKKAVNIPKLKQGNVQADVGRVEVPILNDAVEETG